MTDKENMIPKIDKQIAKKADEFAEREYETDGYERQWLSKGYYHGYKDASKNKSEEPVSEDLEEVSKLAEFERALSDIIFCQTSSEELSVERVVSLSHDIADGVLKEARKQIASEIDIDGMMAKMFDPHEGQSQIPRSFYRQGIEDVLKAIQEGGK